MQIKICSCKDGVCLHGQAESQTRENTFSFFLSAVLRAVIGVSFFGVCNRCLHFNRSNILII